MSIDLRCGDALTLLREMDEASVQTCVTSPPYWGLRDYGTARWEGGDAECDHRASGERRQLPHGDGRINDSYADERHTIPGVGASYKSVCRKCGARRIDAQLGLERTPQEYVERMVEVLREVRREQRGYAQQMKDSPHRRRMEAEAGKAFAHYIRTDLSGGRPLPPDLLDQWLERGWLVEPPPCSCPVMPGDTVLDPFAGAGTTGLVADRLGRSFIGCELNPAYVTLARRRIMDDAPLFNGVAE